MNTGGLMQVGEQFFYNYYQKVNTQSYNESIGLSQNILNLDSREIDSGLITEALLKDGLALISFTPSTPYHEVLDQLKKIFGECIPDSGIKQSEYSVIEYQENSKYFANSAISQPIHSDDAHTSCPPEVISLYCESQSTHGGLSTLCLFKDIYKKILVPRMNQIESLLKEDCLKINGMKGELLRPLLVRRGPYHFGCYLPSILYSMELSSESFNVFKEIMNFVHNPQNQIRIKLKPGQVLLLENSRAYHGRTTFPTSEQRRMLRACFNLKV